MLLAQRIDRALEDRESIALIELLEWYPVTKGLPEVVTYLQLATRSKRHSVEASTIDSMEVESLTPGSWLQLKLPQVVFRR